VLKKPSQECRIEIFEAQIRRLPAQGRGGKLQQHAERIAVRRDGVWARPELGE
jgi:hypothetical protein